MSELYSADEELPADIGDAVVEDAKPVGPPNDEETATVDETDQ